MRAFQNVDNSFLYVVWRNGRLTPVVRHQVARATTFMLSPSPTSRPKSLLADGSLFLQSAHGKSDIHSEIKKEINSSTEEPRSMST